jgi:hypothetical protein
MRLHRDVKIVASGLTRFVNMTVQIDVAICGVKLNVSAFSFLRVRLASPDCRESKIVMVSPLFRRHRSTSG